MPNRIEYTKDMIEFINQNKNLTYSQIAKKFNEQFNTKRTKDQIRFKMYQLFKNERRLNPHHYTEEQEAFLRECSYLPYKEVCSMFNDSFGTDLSESAIVSKMNKSMGIKKSTRAYFSDEEISWIKSQPVNVTRTRLLKMFNDKFNRNVSEPTFFKFLYDNSIRMDKRHHYTQEQNEFLKRNIGKYTYGELTKLFNKKFGCNVSKCSLTGQCINYLKIHRECNTKNHLDIYTERNMGNGRVRVKVTMKEGLPKNERWVPKHRIIYEKENGEIPEGYVVIFLDRNPENLSPDNLYAISKSTHAIMASHNWFTENAENTLTAIKWCELWEQIKLRQSERSNPCTSK